MNDHFFFLRIQEVSVEAEAILDVSHHPLNFSINVLLAQEAVLNPTTDIEPLMDQLMIIEKIQVCAASYPRSPNFCAETVVDCVGKPRISIPCSCLIVPPRGYESTL